MNTKYLVLEDIWSHVNETHYTGMHFIIKQGRMVTLRHDCMHYL